MDGNLRESTGEIHQKIGSILFGSTRKLRLLKYEMKFKSIFLLNLWFISLSKVEPIQISY